MNTQLKFLPFAVGSLIEEIKTKERYIVSEQHVESIKGEVIADYICLGHSSQGTAGSQRAISHADMYLVLNPNQKLWAFLLAAREAAAAKANPKKD